MLLEPLTEYTNLLPVGRSLILEAGWQFTLFCGRLAVLFEPNGSELEPGSNEYVAGLGIRLLPPFPNSHYFLVLLFSSGFDRSLLLGTDVQRQKTYNGEASFSF